MSTGVGGAIKRAAATRSSSPRSARRPFRSATRSSPPAGRLAARWSSTPSRSIAIGGRAPPSSSAAVRSAFARAREHGVESLAIPALGTGVGGFPLDEAARITVATVRDGAAVARPSSRASPSPSAVRPPTRPSSGPGRAGGLTVEADPARRTPADEGRRSFPRERTDEQRDELVEQVAREILFRGLTGPGRPLPPREPALPAARQQAMLFFDPTLRGLFGGDVAPALAILADDIGIEQLIDRLEELDEDDGLDA